MEIKHLQLGNRVYSYSLMFVSTDELIISFYDGIQKKYSLTVKILSYDPVTGFLAYSIDNRVIQAVVTAGQQHVDVLLQGVCVAIQCKKIHTLQSEGAVLFSSECTVKKDGWDLVSPLSGRVVQIFVKNGDFVKSTTPLLVIESMKMENVIYASHDAYIKNVFISIGDLVKQNQKLVSFKQAGEIYGASQATNEY
ncbi:biotin/lipoyl-binding protein [Candidatus Dependentiae bacterium]|nr:biotin/lipoyl-binding protein [Candidatus Dependentiae bacterium]